MGRVSPPLYKLEDCMGVINKISEVDEKINEQLLKRLDCLTDSKAISKIDKHINELMIQRELYVKDLQEKVKTTTDSEDKD